MTKKDFITVAQALQKIPSSSDRWLTTNLIADSLAAAYSNFDIDKFIEYAMRRGAAAPVHVCAVDVFGRFWNVLGMSCGCSWDGLWVF